MPLSPIFNTTPYYHINQSVDDVQDIIDDLRTRLLAIGWTEPVANSFRNPADIYGRQMTLAFVRNTATALLVTFTDHLGRSTPQGRINISGTVTVKYFYSTNYLHLSNVTAATPEHIMADILVLSPEPENAHNGYLYVSTYLTAAGASWGSSRGASLFNFASGAYEAFSSQAVIMIPITSEWPAQPSIQTTPAGFRRWFPAIATGIDSDSSRHIRGRLPNTIYMTGNAAQIGNRYTVSIDEATTASFEVLAVRDSVNPSGTFFATRVP